MFNEISNLDKDEAINLIYNLLTILNKGLNEEDDDIAFENIVSSMEAQTIKLFYKILTKMDYKNIEEELVDTYSLELDEILQSLISESSGVDLEIGRKGLAKLEEDFDF